MMSVIMMVRFVINLKLYRASGKYNQAFVGLETLKVKRLLLTFYLEMTIILYLLLLFLLLFLLQYFLLKFNNL